MAIEFHWVGCHETPTTGVKLCFHCTAADTVTATLNGVTKSATADTAVHDGNVVLSWDGLSPDTVYTASVENFTPHYAPVKARTWPTDFLRVAHFSCVEPGAIDLWALQASKHAPHVVIANDDYPYTNNAVNSEYVASASSILDSDDAAVRADQENYAKHHRREIGKRGIQKLFAQGCNLLYMPGDHEWCGDDWDHDATGNPSLSALFTTQADCDAAWDAGRKACESYMIGNPTNSDAGVVAEYPKTGAVVTVDSPTTPESNYPPLYFRVGNTAVEIFLNDAISHRSPAAATDDADKVMFGSVQQAWIEAKIAASTAPFKLWVQGKYLFPLDAEPAASDRFDKYATNRDAILTSLNGTTCVISVAGDKHAPNIGQTESPDMCCICACPSGVNISDHDLTFGPATQHVPATRASTTAQVYGYGVFTTDSATMQLRRVLGDRPVWTGTFSPDSNLPTYPNRRIA